MAYYITGDCHGDFRKIEMFCRNYCTNKQDYMLILGDVGVNYWFGEFDKKTKFFLSQLPISFFMIHGNHEERPFHIETYKQKEWHGGLVYYEEEFPNLLFAMDGEIYDFDGKKAIVVGGAYSKDKEDRWMMGLPWFESEQPNQEIKMYVEEKLEKIGWNVDYVFSHTCPLAYEPVDLFHGAMNQDRVDKTTEEWLSRIRDKLTYTKWYFGHFHENREYYDAEMLYEGIKELGGSTFLQKVGLPVYQKGETVLFYPQVETDGAEVYGTIAATDAYGTFEQSREVSYDINGYDHILYKHIPESKVYGFFGKEEWEIV